MPQKRSILDRPHDIHEMNFPEGDPNAMEAMINRFAGGMLDGPMVEQRPGASNEMPELAGALASMLPLSKLLKLFKGEQAAANLGDQALRTHKMPHEFSADIPKQDMAADLADMEKNVTKRKPGVK